MENKFIEIKSKNHKTYIQYKDVRRVVVKEKYIIVTTGSGFGALSFQIKDRETIELVMNYIKK